MSATPKKFSKTLDGETSSFRAGLFIEIESKKQYIENFKSKDNKFDLEFPAVNIRKLDINNINKYEKNEKDINNEFYFNFNKEKGVVE